MNAACAIIATLNDFVAHEVDTQVPTTFTVGRIRGGDAINVIPGRVDFAGTKRSLWNAVRDPFEAGLRRIAEGVCASRGIRAEVAYRRNYPPLVNAADETLVAARAAARVVGAENVDANAHAHGFGRLRVHAPGETGQLHPDRQRRGRGGGCMVHNPRYDFNDAILPLGATHWVELVRELLPVRA